MNKENLLRYIDGRAEEVRKAYNEVIDLLENIDYGWNQNDEEKIKFVADLLNNKEINLRIMRDKIKEIDL